MQKKKEKLTRQELLLAQLQLEQYLKIFIVAEEDRRERLVNEATVIN